MNTKQEVLYRIRKIATKALCALVVMTSSLMLPAEKVYAQRKNTVKVQGTVVDASTKETLPGVICKVDKSDKAASTDIDGRFEIELKPGTDQILIFHYLGYESAAIPWKGEKTINVEMNVSIEALEETVVVGYGTQKKSDITGAISSVSKDRINKMVSTDLAQMIQGSVPGLNIMATSAGANPEGQSGLMLIRGRNSITAGNDPLIILDGVPYYGSISDISSTDIESIEVLKDASSAAIYGSRASNGVILINTRQGEESDIKIKYDGFYAFQSIANFPHIMTGDEYVAYKQNWVDDGDDTDADDMGLNSAEQSVYDDGSWRDWTWKELLTQKGYSTRHSLSATGGTKSTKYNISLNYLNNQGVIINDKYERAQFRVNLTTKLTDWLSYTTNTMLTWSDNSGATPKFVDVFNKSPLLRPFNEDGSINIVPDASNEKRFNPLECLLYDDYNASYKVITNNSFVAKIAKGLTYTLHTGIQYNTAEHNQYQGTNTAAMKSFNGWGSLYDKKKFSYSIENIVNFQRDFGKHGVFLTGLFALEGDTNRSTTVEGTDFPNDFLSYNGIPQAKKITTVIGKSDTRLMSYMFRANYDYNDRYLFSATVRSDGYSGFGENNKWGIFPSAAVGWNIANEGFFKEAKNVVNILKLRASWGRNGNQAISAYQSLSTLGSQDYVNGSGLAAGFTPSRLGTGSLSWETTESMNLGLDIAFLKSRITGEFNIYRNNTYDLLLQRSISSINGIQSIFQNIGATKNEGVEMALTSTNISKKNFSWKTTLNMALIRTQITEIYGDGKDDIDNKWFIGSPIKVNYDYYITGVWQNDEAGLASLYGAKPGYAKYDDLNNNGTYDSEDRQIIGSPEPNFTWSLNNQFTYKGFDLIVYVYGAEGMVKYNPFYARNILVPHNWWSAENPTDDCWSKDEKQANQYIAGKTITPGKYEDASFVRIKDITLSYTLPYKAVSALNISNAKVYFSGKNLFTFTKYTGMDPELDEQRAKPVQKEFVLGVSLTF